MFTAKDLCVLGIPNSKNIMPLAMRLAGLATHNGMDITLLQAQFRKLCRSPEDWLDHDLFGELAKAIHSYYPFGIDFLPRETPAPWKQWGDTHIDDSAIQQMEKTCTLPIAVRGALMPDAHVGYGLPIGGVLAVKGAVIPYAVGVDIACRMRLSVLDMPASAFGSHREDLINSLEKQTRFGVGANFEKGERHKHAVMDEDWRVSRITKHHRDKAWKQLGSSGGGNHFVEFGELYLDTPAVLGGKHLEKGTYLALLSHSGSRGTGEAVALHFSKLAKELRPGLPKEIEHLAWLDLESAEGQEYWAAMELMGRYASANHELIHSSVLEHLGAEPLAHVENHHNFAWREEYDGQSVVVHRKGATPAGAGVQGIVPGSMGDPGFVVQGKGNAEALNSCSHGAGRIMSRTEAFRTLDKDAVALYLADRGVELLSGGLDEAPMAYKDINAVMAAQRDLVDILARFEPRLVKMAPGKERKKPSR